MRLLTKNLSFLVFGLFSITEVQAITLLEAYTLARDNDPTFQAAFYAHQAGQEFKALGRSNLLPVVTASYSRYKNHADIDFENGLVKRTEQRDYTSQTASVQLRQPLINFDGYARYKQGVAQTSLSDQEFAIREQELILRVFNRYAAVLYAEDMLGLAKSKRAAYSAQKQANLFMYENGEGTKTDILESQAKYDLAEADIVEAQNILTDARATLNKVLGKKVDQIQPLIEDFATLPVEPINLEQWESLALKSNLELAAQRHTLEVAEQEVNRSKAAYMPRLDAVMSWSNNVSDTTNTYNQDATVNSIGLQFTLPIYSGGATPARVSQSKANLLKAKAEFDEKANAVIIELQKQFNLVLDSQLRLTALTTAVNSAQLLVTATHKSIKGGTRTNIDVLNAESQLFEAKGDLLLARYNYLQSYLNLKKVVGTLGFDDLQIVAARFQN
jgi:protease secretion system outer membrane protein